MEAFEGFTHSLKLKVYAVILVYYVAKVLLLLHQLLIGQIHVIFDQQLLLEQLTFWSFGITLLLQMVIQVLLILHGFSQASQLLLTLPPLIIFLS